MSHITVNNSICHTSVRIFEIATQRPQPMFGMRLECWKYNTLLKNQQEPSEITW